MSESGYRVLARKYRPETFTDLVGQEAVVRTFTNAFASGRLAQAFIMTGIRGTGKTTTARIIAKGLNCIGPDGQGGPTVEPCGQCVHCRDIAEGRHVDVIEIDAASHTGVQNIRDTILETVSYRAATARYKVFIIDEVHMLSSGAFNALLKTLEEPPEHVKFIMATTEIRKVPVTVLSRCQRFDLRRIEAEDMMGMLTKITTSEGADIDQSALALIARAAEGSARDATSLLDQAISHGGAQGTVGVDAVRAMLGVADQARVLDLFDHVMAGRAASALAELGAQYADGADPIGVLRALAETSHWLSLLQVAPEAADDPTVTPDERDRGQELAGRLGIPVLTRAWQILLKSIEESSLAPNAMMAAEMAIIRLTHVANMPPPEKLIRELTAQSTGGDAPNGPPRPASTPNPGPRASMPSAVQTAPAEIPLSDPMVRLGRFEDVVALIREHRDLALLMDVETHLHLVSYAPGRIDFQPGPNAPADLASRLGRTLQGWTGQRWGVSVSASGGAQSLAQRNQVARDEADAALRTHPLVAAVFQSFPNARIEELPQTETNTADISEEALAPVEEMDEDWDPFEQD